MPEAAFADPELQAATPDEAVLGLPRAITGAFAAVFPMTLPSDRRVAVKCFTREAPERQHRYRAIARHLDEAALPYTVGFDYQSEGIYVEDHAFPLLKMDWAVGKPLNAFAEAHLDAPDVLDTLAHRFAEMLEALGEHNIAHGDLQHGNVLVNEREDEITLRLVDYDTMYVPALKNNQSTEVGHRNYQHPDRDEHDFGPHLDRFSGRVIHTALRALQYDPSLWDRFDTGENMLFRADDFYAPGDSSLFEALMQIEDVRPLAETLRTACYLEPEDIPPLAGDAAETDLSAGWIDRQAAPARRTPNRRVHRREGLARYFLPGVGAGITVAAILFVAGFLLSGTLVAGLTLGIGSAAAWRKWHRLPAVRRRRRLRSEIAYAEHVIAGHRRQIETRQQQRRDVEENVEALREERLRELQERALRDRLKHHFVNEAKAVDGIGHRVVVRLKAAGIRAAHQATPDRLADVRRIGDRHRARVRMWRASLVREYEDEVPDRLSPAEERRLRRSVERRAQGFAEDIERLHAKIQVQEEEKQVAQERLEREPHISFGRYLRYLLRLARLPRALDSGE